MNQNVHITQIICEHLREPISLDMRHPRFTWVAAADEGGAQAAYQIQVASSPFRMADEKADVWDSGWIESSLSAMVPYAGPDLAEETDYWIRVRIRDFSGSTSDWSAFFRFGTAFFTPDQSLWQKLWLTTTEYISLSPSFRREFEINKTLARARLYFSGLGYGQLSLNGQRVGNHELDPAWTDYRHSIMYVTHDVTHLLQPGLNAVGVRLGNGWFAPPSFKAPQFAMRLHLFYADGSDEWVESKPRQAWKMSYDGDIRGSSIYHGETIDAGLRKPGWDRPGFDLSAPDAGRWVTPLDAEAPGGKMKSQLLEPIEIVSSWHPLSAVAVKNGVYVLDAGQNISGWVSASLSGKQGQCITLQYAEALRDDGTVHTDNLRTAKATDVFVLSGCGTDHFRPSFTFHGFRYVQISGLDAPPVLDDWLVEVVRSAVLPRGVFQCSDPLLERIQQMCWWTECTNLMGLPTDCPQRDERLGWLNDMTVRAEEAMYNFGMGGLYSKWLQDISEAQGKTTGAITDTAPFTGFGQQPADPVCSSYLVIPWLLYLHGGDRRILEQHYDGLKAWVGYLENQTDDGLVGYSYFGDWASPIGGAIEGSNGCGAVSAITPGALMSTGYLYFDACLMEKIARLLDHQDDVRRFAELAEKTAAAFQRAFYHENEHYYGLNSQAANVFALYLGLVPAEDRQHVIGHVVADLREQGGHFTTGNQCTKYLMDILSENGYEDLAYDIVSSHEYPGWGFMLDHGATTVWERWEHVTEGPEIGMASLNHPMNAVISVWFYKHLCGLKIDPEQAGFARFLIEPVFPKKLDAAQCWLDTVKGKVAVGWKREAGKITLNITVPYNSTAVARFRERAAVLTTDFTGRTIAEQEVLDQTDRKTRWMYTLPAGNHLLQLG